MEYGWSTAFRLDREGAFHLRGLELALGASPVAVDVGRHLGAFDSLFIMLFDLGFAAVALSWMAVVAPLQYVITLGTGAPARGALASRRIWVERGQNTVLLLKKGPAAKMPEGAEEIGFAGRPVTVTSSITAGTLFVVSLLT